MSFWALGSPEKCRAAAEAWSTVGDHLNDAYKAVQAVPDWVGAGTWTGTGAETARADLQTELEKLGRCPGYGKDMSQRLTQVAADIDKAIDRAHTALYAGIALFAVAAIATFFTFGISAAAAAAGEAAAAEEAAATILSWLTSVIAQLFSTEVLAGAAIDTALTLAANTAIVTGGKLVAKWGEPWKAGDLTDILITSGFLSVAGAVAGKAGAGLSVGKAVMIDMGSVGSAVSASTAIQGLLKDGKVNAAQTAINGLVAGTTAGAIRLGSRYIAGKLGQGGRTGAVVSEDLGDIPLQDLGNNQASTYSTNADGSIDLADWSGPLPDGVPRQPFMDSVRQITLADGSTALVTDQGAASSTSVAASSGGNASIPDLPGATTGEGWGATLAQYGSTLVIGTVGSSTVGGLSHLTNQPAIQTPSSDVVATA